MLFDQVARHVRCIVDARCRAGDVTCEHPPQRRGLMPAAVLQVVVLLIVALPLGSLAQAGDSATEPTTTFAISTFENAEALVNPMQQVISEAYQRLGIHISIHRMPLTRSLSEANSGRYDAELGRVLENEVQAPNLLRVPIAIGVTEYRAYMLRSFARPELASWEGLRASGLHIGGRLGARVPEVQLGDALNVHSKSQQALMKMLADHRVDVVVGTLTTTRAILTEMQRQQPDLVAQIVELEPALQKQPFYHFLHQRHAALLPRLSAELAAMEKDGSIARIWREAAEQDARQ